jgi:carnitine O-palmitoyltransferase 1
MALTTLPRTQWAEIRDRYFGEGQNRKSLVIIEKAAFLLNLVSESRLSPGVTSPSNGASLTSPKSKFFSGAQGEADVPLNKRAHFLFHGEGSDIWFDKSFNLIVFEDGQAGINAEMTFGDAPVVAHMWEYALLNELIDFENCRDASALAGESLRGAPLPMPLRLEFTVSEQLSGEMKRAKREVRDASKDIDLDILCFEAFGREFIKALGASPDSFIQMALLLTTYVDGPAEKFGLAYESGHTRLFREGRTETIRSVTKQSLAFIKHCSPMLSGAPLANLPPASEAFLDQARQLLLEACAAHQQLSVECVAGNGIDRHLFALNVAAKGLEIKSDFLDFATTRMTWSLSSSQQPQVQTKLRAMLPETTVKDFFCPGGGYAPISDDGYGVAYTPLPSQLFFHVTSKKSSAHTNAKRFSFNLRRALELLRLILKHPPTANVS